MLDTLFASYDRLVLFDTETTGLIFNRDEIIEFAAVAVELQNGAEVTFADNTTVINDKTFTMNITVDATSTLTLDATSSITATTLTVADGGKFTFLGNYSEI